MEEGEGSAQVANHPHNAHPTHPIGATAKCRQRTNSDVPFVLAAPIQGGLIGEITKKENVGKKNS